MVKKVSFKNVGRVVWIIPVLALWFSSCQTKHANMARPMFIHEIQDSLSAAIIHDGFPPPVAARIYAYSSMAAYEALRLGNPDSFPTFSGKANDLHLDIQLEKGKQYDFQAAMVSALCKVSEVMVYRSYITDSAKAKIYRELKDFDDADVLDRSDKLGMSIGAQINAWASKDHYKETRTMPRFEPSRTDSTWVPTPPGYSDGIEPYWGTIRSVSMDSASQFRQQGPPPYSTDPNSLLYQKAKEVMDYQTKASQDQKLIAMYWDCNPLRTFVKGHIMFNGRQISPGGHWMSICKMACHIKNLPELQAARAYALTGIAVDDGFISCWREKYYWNYIRPETYINRHIDKTWIPLIETPPFPEYPSAHSTISASAAKVLESVFGQNFAFNDSSEVPFHMDVRHYGSFKDAANQAAISRLYGGIHYMTGCNDGIRLGEQVGDQIVQKFNTPNIP